MRSNRSQCTLELDQKRREVLPTCMRDTSKGNDAMYTNRTDVGVLVPAREHDVVHNIGAEGRAFEAPTFLEVTEKSVVVN